MLRDEIPRRSRSGQFAKTNRTYKKYLMKDFKNKCAYCGDLDSINCGSRFYHVEHFAPKEKFPELEFVYDNLLYACPFCNNYKSDKWVSDDSSVSVVGDKGFVSPCEPEYDKHLDRDNNGKIYAKTKLGEYMMRELNLYLQRHEIIYNIEMLLHKVDALKVSIASDRVKGIDVTVKEIALFELNENFIKYYKIFNQLNSD